MEGAGQGCSTGQGRGMLGVWDPPPGNSHHLLGVREHMWDNPTSHWARGHAHSPAPRVHPRAQSPTLPHCAIPTLHEGTAFLPIAQLPAPSTAACKPESKGKVEANAFLQPHCRRSSTGTHSHPLPAAHRERLCQLRPCSCEHTEEQSSTDTQSWVLGAADGAEPGHRPHSAASCWLSAFHALGKLGAPAKHRQQPAQHPQCTQRIRLSAPNTQHRAESRGETGKPRPWQVGQPWLEGGVLIGSHWYKICADKDVLPSWGMCHPPGGCATHLGDTSPILGTYHPPKGTYHPPGGHTAHLGDTSPVLGTCHPPGAHVTYLGAISPTWGEYHPHRGHIIHRGVVSPTWGSYHSPTWGSHHPPGGHITHLGDVPPSWLPMAAAGMAPSTTSPNLRSAAVEHQRETGTK